VTEHEPKYGGNSPDCRTWRPTPAPGNGRNPKTLSMSRMW
jgi:hypothetical protein